MSYLGDFQRYIQKYGFHLQSYKDRQDIVGVYFLDLKLFNVPAMMLKKKMKDYVALGTTIQHPTYQECIKKADSWGRFIQQKYREYDLAEREIKNTETYYGPGPLH